MAAKNIRALISAQAQAREGAPVLGTYAANRPAMLVHVGRLGGAGQLPNANGSVVGPFTVKPIKGKGLFIRKAWRDLGYPGEVPQQSQDHVRPRASERVVTRLAAALRLEHVALRELLDRSHTPEAPPGSLVSV